VPDVQRADRRRDSIAEHPIGLLTPAAVPGHGQHRQPADERHDSMTEEIAALVEAFGYGLGRPAWFTVNAMKSAFLPFDERLALIIDDVIKP
jgi:adenosine deaminase